MTNRDLYLFVTQEFGQGISKEKVPNLESFLIALWQTVSLDKKSEPTIEKLVLWLEKAIKFRNHPKYDSDWLRFIDYSEENSFGNWEGIILNQIAHLNDLDKLGKLNDPQRYFGIGSWYNFDIFTYLECAVRGMFGGYETSEVIVLDGSGDSEIFEIKEFTWEDFCDFLQYGSSYE